MSEDDETIQVRTTGEADFQQIISLSRKVYPGSPAWREEQLASHLRVFREGQLVAVDPTDGAVVGMAASLVVLWDDYEMHDTWRDFTDRGWFTNHDLANGRTLYGAEVMVDPARQRRGVGGRLYAARRRLAQELGLRRIRAGARLRGFARWAGELTAEQYVRKVVRGEISDPTLSFQLRHGFRVVAVVGHYLRHDPESLGYAAVIEWLNPATVATTPTKTPFDEP